jgi:hypothetical protein
MLCSRRRLIAIRLDPETLIHRVLAEYVRKHVA